jgi:DNA invertase Pin-like site-specific DNA recombinase
LSAYQQGLSRAGTGGSAGMLYANILAAFANFERERIRERTYAGLARARAQGKKLGRPKGAKDKRPRRRRKNPPLQTLGAPNLENAE